jgi:hypothetical protein
MPHTADASLGRKRANVMGALDYARNQLHYEICEHSVCRDDVLSFLDRLASASSRDKWTFIVLDNASMHHHIDQSILDRWILLHRFVPLYLPPYSPELNLIEILWKHAKYHWREFKSWSKDALVEEVRSLLDGFGQKLALSRFEWNTPPWSGVGHSRTAVAGSRAGRRVFACLAKRTLDALRAKYA